MPNGSRPQTASADLNLSIYGFRNRGRFENVYFVTESVPAPNRVSEDVKPAVPRTERQTWDAIRV